MDLLPNDEQEALLSGARSFLAAALPMVAPRWLDRLAIEKRALQEFATLGWYGLSVPEHAGGAGLGLAEQTLLLAEAGKHLAPIGVLSGMLAAELAVSANNTDLVAQILRGECQVGLALPVSNGHTHLIDAVSSHQIVVLHANGPFLVACGVFKNRHPLACVDSGVSLERISQSTIDPTVSNARGVPYHLHPIVLVCALLVGLAESVMAIAVAHAKDRHQFGQPIGAFQAVKHPLADMAMRAEAARFQTMVAALSITEGLPDAALQAHAAAVVASRAATANANAAVQIFGAMGYTQDCIVHHFVKRAVVLNQLMSGRLRHLDILVAQKFAE